MNFKDIKLSIDTPYDIRDLVCLLRQELTLKEADEFTDLWSDYETDEEIISKAEGLITNEHILKLAENNLDNEEIFKLAKDNLDGEQALKLTQDKAELYQIIESIEDWDGDQLLELAKNNLDNHHLELLIEDAFNKGLEEETLETLKSILGFDEVMAENERLIEMAKRLIKAAKEKRKK